MELKIQLLTLILKSIVDVFLFVITLIVILSLVKIYIAYKDYKEL